MSTSAKRSRRAPGRGHHCTLAVAVVALVASALLRVGPAVAAEDNGAGQIAQIPQDLPVPSRARVPVQAPASPPVVEKPPPPTLPPNASAKASVKGYEEGKSKELVEERRADAKVFLNPDATRTERIYAKPVHFKVNGKWQDIDATLVAEAGGFKNAAGPVDVRLAANADSNRLISIGADGRRVTLALDGARSVRGKAVGPVVTYASVAEDADLELHVNSDSVKETVILHKAPANGQAARYRFRLDPGGLQPVMSAAGNIELRTPDGTVAAMIPAPVLFDSAFDPASSEPSYGPATMTLAQSPSGWTITLEADAAWLNQPGRQWPVYLDPTAIWVYGPQDAFVMSRYPTTNYNVSWNPTLNRYEDKIGYYDATTGWTESYFRYDIEQLAGKQLLSAAWYGFFIWSYSTGQTPFQLHALRDAFNPADLTYNNRPWARPDVANGSGVRDQWSGVDITGWVGNWLSGAWANSGIMVDTGGQGTAAWKKLAADENTDWSRSFIAVTYGLPPTVSPVAPANGASLHTLTPTLSVSGSDPEGQQLNYFFRLCLGSNAESNCVWDSGWGTSASVTVPANLLTANTTYYWHTYIHDGYYVTGPPWVSWFSTANAAPVAPSWVAPPSGAGFTASPTLTATYGDGNGDPGWVYFWIVNSAGAIADEGLGSYTGSGGTSSYTVKPLPEGAYTIVALAVDSWGAGSPASDLRVFYIDPSAPLAPTVSATPHTSPDAWYSNAAPTFSFSATDLSGIGGWSYVLDQSPSTTPDTTSEGTATTKAYSGLAEGPQWFHVRARNGAGVFGPPTHFRIQIDLTAPVAPASVASSSHTPGTPSANRNVSVTWPAGTDTLSGVAGYATVFNQSATDPAGAAVTSTAASATSAALGDGNWWFHVRTIDRAGNASTDRSYGAFVIDGTGPAAPQISSSTHGQDTWSASRSASFTWPTPGDANPVTGYSVVLNQTPMADPDITADTANGSWSEPNVGDGEWWLHVRGVDSLGNWGATGHYRVRVDASIPAGPVVSSSTHPDPSRLYANPSPVIAWVDPPVPSGVSGFSWTVDQVAGTVPDTASEGAGHTVTLSNVAEGLWWFHARAQGGTGLWGETSHFRIGVFGFADAQPFDVPDDQGGGISIPDLLAPLLGLVSTTTGSLASILSPGGLLSGDSFFGGAVMPSSNPVAALGQSLAGLRVPVPAVPDLLALTVPVLDSLRGLPLLLPVFDLLDVLTYDVETVRYAADGTVQSTRTDTFPICVATAYPSTPGGSTADMRVNLCLDLGTVIAPTQRVVHQVDALAEGINAKVTVSWNVLGRRVRIVTDSRSQPLPVDAGTGPAITPSYPCSILSGQSGGPTDTTDGTCVEVVAPPDPSALTLDAAITTAANGPVDAVDLYVDQGTGGGTWTPVYRLGVSRPPASSGHPYQLHAEQPTASDRDLLLRLSLADGATPNPDESLVLEQFSAGTVAFRLRLSDVPGSFSTVMAGNLGAGDIGSAPLVSGTIDSVTTQPAAPDEILDVERFVGGELSERLTIEGFAPTYHYGFETLFGTGGEERGAVLDTSFSTGAPGEGRLALARYQGANLNTSLDLRGLSGATRFETTISGDRNDPDGQTLAMDLANQGRVPGQLLQVVQYPSGGVPRRLVLSDADVDESVVVPAVAGENLRWSSVPPTFHLDLTVANQSSGPGAGLPGRVVVAGTSTDPSPANSLQITSDLGSQGTFGLVHNALTPDHELIIDVSGSLSNIEHARFERRNNASRPQQATQLWLRDSSGLRSQIAFLGTEPATDGLVEGPAAELDGTATGVPDDYAIEFAVTTSPEGVPTDFELEGTNSSFASEMDLRVADRSRGLALRAASLTTDYAYRLHADFVDGQPRAATIESLRASADNPEGVLDVSFQGLRLAARSLKPTFTLRAEVLEGALPEPTRFRLHLDQPEANPSQLLQFAAYDGAIDDQVSPRFALTVANGGAAPILPVEATHADVLITDAPATFQLELGRPANPGGGAAELSGEGPDSPGTAVKVRQIRPGDRQELHMVGLAATWTLKLFYEGALANPDAARIELAAPVRHSTDVVEILTYEGGSSPSQRFVLRGADGTVPVTTPATMADADFRGISESLVLRYQRGTTSGRERFEVGLDNRDAAGAPVALPAAKGNIRRLQAGQLSEELNLERLPASMSLSYTYPNAVIGSLADNCLGDIGYSATDSSLLVELRQRSETACLPGDVFAHIDGVPSLGLDRAELRPDGSGVFKTRPDPATGQLQEIPELTLSAPVPKAVADFVNKPVNIGTEICPSYDPTGLFCADVQFSLDPNYTHMRLDLAAEQLSDAEISTNIGLNGQPKPEPPGGVAHTAAVGHLLWANLPLFAISNQSAGGLRVALSGEDAGGSNLVQDLQCCTSLIKTASRHMELDLAGKPLGARFYGWDVRAGSCAGSSGGPVKCNQSGQELEYTFGSLVHSYGTELDDNLPFHPRFDAYEMPTEVGGALQSKFLSAPGSTRYYVPNFFDLMLSQPGAEGEPPERWSVHNYVYHQQTNWFYAILLHEYLPDPMGVL